MGSVDNYDDRGRWLQLPGDRACWPERRPGSPAAGTGLGRAMALRFAGLGARVGAVGRREQPLEQDRATRSTRRAAARASGPPATCATREAVDRRAAAAAARSWDGIDILVNNAAGNFLCPSEELSPNGFAGGRRHRAQRHVSLHPGRRTALDREQRSTGRRAEHRAHLRLDRVGVRAALGLRQGRRASP